MNQHILLLLACAMLRPTSQCSPEKKKEYISNHLSMECGSGLEVLTQPRRQASSGLFIPSPSDLDTVCQFNCAGLYSTWLRNECQDPHSSRMVEAMCIYTSGTTEIGERCRSAFPDAADNLQTIFRNALNCGIGRSPRTCSPNCHTAMNNLINRLGCCYQSLYNNTDFILHLIDAGLINETYLTALNYLNTAAEWDTCNIRVPPMCEILVADPHTAANVDTINSAPSYHPFTTYTVIFSLLTTVTAHWIV